MIRSPSYAIVQYLPRRSWEFRADPAAALLRIDGCRAVGEFVQDQRRATADADIISIFILSKVFKAIALRGTVHSPETKPRRPNSSIPCQAPSAGTFQRHHWMPSHPK